MNISRTDSVNSNYFAIWSYQMKIVAAFTTGLLQNGVKTNSK